MRPPISENDPKPARLTERPHAAKTRQLLPAASYDTIQVLGFMDAYATSEICLGEAVE
jgi:hypothetical protein